MLFAQCRLQPDLSIAAASTIDASLRVAMSVVFMARFANVATSRSGFKKT
jgi:hypothetical protein